MVAPRSAREAAAAERDGSIGNGGGAARPARAPEGEPYSVEQEAYQEEVAYYAARAKRKRLLAVVRVLALIVLVPVGLGMVFVASYALACIASGASPQELVQLLGELFVRVRSFVS